MCLSHTVLQCVDGASALDSAALKRVAVVEDFFDIIYAMHVEVGADPAKVPKHAGQKKTYKAVRKASQSLEPLSISTLLSPSLSNPFFEIPFVAYFTPSSHYYLRNF